MHQEFDGMNKLPVPLRIVILDADKNYQIILKDTLLRIEGVQDVLPTDQYGTALNAFESGFTCLFIDIFSLGVSFAIEFISSMRAEYPIVPICLFSSYENLKSLPGVPFAWKNRFGHYYKLIKSHDESVFTASVERVIYQVSAQIQNHIAVERINELKQIPLADFVSEDNRRNFEEAVSVIEQTLERKVEETQIQKLILPGVPIDQVEKLVQDTLSDARQSLRRTVVINIGILIFGVLLVFASFIIAVWTERWEAVAFGGFGIAGVVASLISNPLKSIGSNASKLVQIQTAYFHFLAQMEMLQNISSDIDPLQRSKRLEDAMFKTLEVLQNAFDK
jgi:hypothetical protein